MAVPYIDKKIAKEEIGRLVEKYNKVLEENRVSKYNEEMTKKNFILPLFHALGWDIDNSKGEEEVTAELKELIRKQDIRGFVKNAYYMEKKNGI